MEPVLAVAREHGLLVIEDCAQAFDGGTYRGHPETDVAMFSFGPIKTATALGGAVLRIRDSALRETLRRGQAAYPVQPRARFLRRLAKHALLKAFSSRAVFAALVRGASAAGFDCDRLINGSVRGFAGPDFFDQIRQQPSAPLLALLLRRLRRFDRRRLARRTALGQRLARLLADKVSCPNAAAAVHSHWVFPILVEDPVETIAALREAGFDATQGGSMAAVPPPAGRADLTPRCAVNFLAQAVYLPIYPEMPDDVLEKMAGVVASAATRKQTARACPDALG
jgi:dTDP-4-amino-4,6-dideoxygalactose transaminase